MPSHSMPEDKPNHNQPRWSAPASFGSLGSYLSYLRQVPVLYTILVTLCFLSSSTSTPVDAQAAATAQPALATCPVQQSVASGKFDPTVDYFPVKPTITDATLFSIAYHNSYKVISNLKVNEQYIVYMAGTPQPQNQTAYLLNNNNVTPDNHTTILLPTDVNTLKVFASPVNNFAVSETVAVTYLELLGVRNTIKYIDSSSITSGCVQSLAISEPPAVLPFPASYNIIDATTQAQYTAATTNSQLIIGSTSKSKNIKTIADDSSPELSVLGRAEWIKFFGALVNREAAANQIYDGIKTRYGTYKSNAAAAASKTSTAPVVVWTNASPAYGSYGFSLAAYKFKVAQDAGCTSYLPSGKNINDAVSFTTQSDFHSALLSSNADIIIDESYFANGTSVTYNDVLSNLGLNNSVGSDDYNNLKFIRNSQIWREDGLLNAAGASDWFENAIAVGDAVLQDLTRVCQPTAIPSGYSRRWFRNAAQGETIQQLLPTCSDADAPLQAPGSTLQTTNVACPSYLNDPSTYGQTTTPPPTTTPTTPSGSSAMAMININYVMLFALMITSVMMMKQ